VRENVFCLSVLVWVSSLASGNECEEDGERECARMRFTGYRSPARTGKPSPKNRTTPPTTSRYARQIDRLITCRHVIDPSAGLTCCAQERWDDWVEEDGEHDPAVCLFCEHSVCLLVPLQLHTQREKEREDERRILFSDRCRRTRRTSAWNT
jgi:hypothetical protein